MTPMEELGFFDRNFEYLFVPPNGQLTPGQVLNTQISINVDAEFWIAALYQTGDSVYEVMITDSDGYQFSNVPRQSGGIPGVSSPEVISPAHRIPAGGRIQLNITELSGATADMGLVFKGWKRFQKPVPQQ